MKSKKVLFSTFAVVLAAASFLAVAYLSINTNFMVANLGLKASQSEFVADLIMAGSTIATIIGALSALTGIGLLIAGAIGTLKAIAKNQGRRALVNF